MAAHTCWHNSDSPSLWLGDNYRLAWIITLSQDLSPVWEGNLSMSELMLDTREGAQCQVFKCCHHHVYTAHWTPGNGWDLEIHCEGYARPSVIVTSHLTPLSMSHLCQTDCEGLYIDFILNVDCLEVSCSVDTFICTTHPRRERREEAHGSHLCHLLACRNSKNQNFIVVLPHCHSPTLTHSDYSMCWDVQFTLDSLEISIWSFALLMLGEIIDIYLNRSKCG